MTNFNIVSEDEVYAKLFASGYESAKGFFAGTTNWDMLLHRLQTKFGWKRADY
jgi:hypothetical protein